LAEWFFEQWTKDGEVIVDLYAGAGFSIIAAHNLNRRCFACEISPNYGAVILQRFSDAFGTIPELVTE
jgi:DNA modification methylase